MKDYRILNMYATKRLSLAPGYRLFCYISGVYKAGLENGFEKTSKVQNVGLGFFLKNILFCEILY